MFAATADYTVSETREDLRLGFLIHDVSRMRRSAYDQFMKPLGITRAQWWVLAHLGRHDGMVQTQLAELLQVGKASLGDILTGLESQQWLERRPDPGDKRAKRVYLTKAAQVVLQRMLQMENKFNQHTLGSLSREEKRELARTLLIIKTAVSKLDPSATANSDD